LGKKAYDYFLKKKNVEIIDVFYNVFANLKFIEARKIAEFIMQSFKNKEFDIVEVVFNEFKNVVTQIVKNEQFLPILPKIAEQSKMPKTIDYIFEPNKEAILDDLIPKSIKVQFYRYLLESNASEHGARMTAMDKATENAGELLKELRLTYNRTRQAAITKEILEIVGGAEALKTN
jgi:F-type H+-transporting ATPase subunit gamma